MSSILGEWREGKVRPIPGNAGASSVLCKRPFSLRRRLIWAVEKWESWFWISNFPRPTFKSSFWSFFFFV